MLISATDIKFAVSTIDQINNESMIFTATQFSFPIQRAIFVRDGRAVPFDSSSLSMRSQDLEDTFHDAGQFYIGQTHLWQRNKSIFDGGTPLIVPEIRAQDIDTQQDLILAKIKHKLYYDHN